MPIYNHATGEVTAKVVYYGPGLGGKSTNLQWIHDRVSCRAKGRLVSLPTQGDRMLFFDLLPEEPGPIQGMRVRLQIYAVPGPVERESSRRMVLRGCDAVVFVADSQAALLDANVESLHGLRQHLLFNELDPALPQVIQYNKRDRPGALPVPVLDARLNPRHLPRLEAVATQGVGVEDTLRALTALLYERLASDRGETGRASAGAATGWTGEPATPPAVFQPQPAGPATPEPPPGADDLSDGQWLYLLDEVQHGPIELEDLVDLVLSSIPEDTRVWRRGFEGWQAANQVPEIAEQIPPPLPTPGAGQDDAPAEDLPDFAAVPPTLRTALIADEDAAFRGSLALLLAARGFTVHQAADGAAAWQLALHSRPWIILADVALRELDGFELCRRVRRHTLLQRTPLLFISGSDEYRLRYRALQLGADDFLPKRTPTRELLMRMRLLMARYSDLEPRADGARDERAGALEGRVELFGAPALLQILNEGRLTGTLGATAEGDDGRTATLGFREGELLWAREGGTTGEEAVYAFLRWDKGSFAFAPGDPGPEAALEQGLPQLLLEGCRRLDESRRDGDAPAGG